MITKTKLLRLSTALILFSSSLCMAVENRWTHFGVRPLAMGNAYVSVADDFNALFYNPAGLARLVEWDGELINPYLSFGTETKDLITDVIDLTSSNPGTSDVLTFFEGKTGKNLHASLGLTPHLIFQNIGFGIGLNTGVDATMHSDLDIDLKAGIEIILPVSYARNFLNDRLSVGGSIKLRSFAGIDATLDITELSSLSEDDSENSPEQVGNGVGVDLGILFTPVEVMSPTLGISITDLGGTPFQKTGDLNKPNDVLPSVNTGFSIMPYKTDFSFLRLALEAHSINQPIHYSHKLHFGAEMGVSSIFKIQAGLKDGYLAGGFEFDVGLLSLRYANHVVDHGPIVGINDGLIDRRHILQIKLLI